MKLLIALAKIMGATWLCLVIIMLPVYFNRKKKNPCDEKNTVKALIIKALIASVIMTLLFNSGLIAVYFREITGG